MSIAIQIGAAPPIHRTLSARAQAGCRSHGAFLPAAAPKTRPVLYTALLTAPHSLAWLDAPPAPAYETMLCIEGEWRLQRRGSAVIPLPQDVWPEPGVPVEWSIAPVGGQSEGVSGTFRVLRADERDDLAAALGRLDDVSEPAFRTAVCAVVHAQVHLYQDALDILENLLAYRRLCGTLSPDAACALAHRACIWVLRAMESDGGEQLPRSCRLWIAGRIRYHRESLAAAWDPDVPDAQRRCRRREPGDVLAV